MRYYFDLRDDDELFRDDEGMEFSKLAAVQEEATLSLAGMARDAAQKMYDGAVREMAIEVRDEKGPVFCARFTVDVNWNAIGAPSD
jgi:hypothetical protein